MTWFPPVDLVIVGLLQAILREVREMSAELDELNAKVDALQATVGAVVTELEELRSLLDTAVANADLAAIKSVSLRIEGLTKSLANAGAAADPTPETPVPGADPTPTP